MGGASVFECVGDAFTGDEVGGRLDVLRVPQIGHVDRDRHLGAVHQVPKGRGKAVVEDPWPDTAGDVAQLLDRLGDLAHGRFQGARHACRRVTQLMLDMPEGQPDGDHSLLGAVVQVALDPAPFGFGGLDDPQS